MVLLNLQTYLNKKINIETFTWWKETNPYDSQSTTKSTNFSKIWIIQIGVFHLIFESIPFFGFLQKFLEFCSKIRQDTLSGTGFSENMVYINVNISVVYSYIFNRSENFTHIGMEFILNTFEYCRGDTLFKPLIYSYPVEFIWDMFPIF